MQGPLRARVSLVRFILAACLTLLSQATFAQINVSGISGVVKDTSGAVLPGVTVEAASPALIEKIRTVVTDDQGQYKIIDLRPGVYTVTFGLTGFSGVRREGLELGPNFTATVNAELRIGSLEETITVSGQSPVVDVQNVTQQSTMSRQLLDAVPSNKSMLSFAALTPAVVSVTTAQDVGGSKGELSVRMQVHGSQSGDQKLLQDGMVYNSLRGGGSGRGFFINPASAQEVVLQLGAGGSAQYSVGGVHVDLIPKDGGNQFNGYGFLNGTNHRFQSDNLSSELQARGLKTVNHMNDIYDINGALGGPVKQDRLWFYTAHRHWGQSSTISNLYHNATQSSWVYTPDLSRPAESVEWNNSHNLRLTSQLSKRNKVTLSYDYQNNCSCQVNLATAQNVAWEATQRSNYVPSYLIQSTWSFPATSKLLFEAGWTTLRFNFTYNPQEGVSPSDISVLEQSTGFRYRSFAFSYGPIRSNQSNQRFSVSYVTGSHHFKAGFSMMEGRETVTSAVNGDVNYVFTNGQPTSLTMYATPYTTDQPMKADLGLYAQDQWTIHRLTLNLGLRFDYLNAYDAATTQPEGRFIPARSFAEVECLPCWKDINPRIGAAFDVFGNGKTAIKGSVGRYVASETISQAGAYNPVNTSVNSVTRAWTDSNNNFIPDCNMRNPAQNGECQPMSNAAFGQLNIVTRPKEGLLNAWGNRSYNWQASAVVQHELTPGIAISAGYYRTWFGNFTATDNLSVTPADYSPYCITAPVDARLPGGGGNQLCGFYDISPAKFGQVNNQVTLSEEFGTQTQVYNGVDFNSSARWSAAASTSATR